jgi:superfamily II helicase
MKNFKMLFLVLCFVASNVVGAIRLTPKEKRLPIEQQKAIVVGTNLTATQRNKLIYDQFIKQLESKTKLLVNAENREYENLIKAFNYDANYLRQCAHFDLTAPSYAHLDVPASKHELVLHDKLACYIESLCRKPAKSTQQGRATSQPPHL